MGEHCRQMSPSHDYVIAGVVSAIALVAIIIAMTLLIWRLCQRHEGGSSRPPSDITQPYNVTVSKATEKRLGGWFRMNNEKELPV